MLNWEIEGVVQLQRSFSRFTEYLEDIRGVYPEFKQIFYDNEARQFRDSVGDGSWAQLTEPYGTWKSINFPSQPILVRTGLLRETMQGDTPYIGWTEEEQELSVDIKLNYALYHQKGTSKMKAREVIWFDENTKDQFTRKLHEWLWGVQKSVGLGGRPI